MDSQDERTTSLERQYIELLEKRVAQLQGLVNSSATDGKTIHLNGDGKGVNPNKDKSGASILKASLTKDNLDDVVDGAAKDVEIPQKDQDRVRQVMSKLNDKTGLVEDIPMDKALKDEGTKSACILRNVMNSRHEIDLGPGPLLKLMKDVMNDENVDQTWTGQTVNLVTPFMSLVHKWDILKKVTNEEEGDSTERKEARADLTKVLDFVQSSKGLEAYFKNRESHQNSQVIEFEYLWTIFSTGTEVIASTFMEEKQIMIVSAPPYKYDDQKAQSLVCWYYDHDGTDWVVAQRVFEIDRKDASSTSLEELKVIYTTRGKRFKHLCQAKPGVKQMFHYDGQGLTVESAFRKQNNIDTADEHSSSQSSTVNNADHPTFKKTSVDGSIQVDPLSYLEQAPLGDEDLWLGEEEIYISPIKEKRYDISEEKKFLLAPPRVLGWSSVHNHWCQFRVDKVKEAKKAKEAIFDNELQLEPSVKNMIEALVTQHNSQEGGKGVQNPDLIEGKGRGLVIMLHGRSFTK
ncbi:MAG: hypothetical protein Q9204_002404 [Flavoplaca sp. TL-2023a]